MERGRSEAGSNMRPAACVMHAPCPLAYDIYGSAGSMRTSAPAAIGRHRTSPGPNTSTSSPG
eukprot:scaffold84653_cov45-Phaeocystis_antarctica.AAC.1